MRISRSVEWPDTDAAGHYHHATIIRWAEAAEAALLEQLDLAHLFGATPRVRYEVDYTQRLWFGDRVTIAFEVDHLGRTSVRYAFAVYTATDTVAAKGTMTAVHIDRATGKPTPWPDDVQARLTG